MVPPSRRGGGGGGGGNLADVEAGKAVVGVGGDVGVHHIQQHYKTQAVRHVHQRLHTRRAHSHQQKPCGDDAGVAVMQLLSRH